MTGASARAVEHHYDVGNAFYELWLDDLMVYSAAMFGAAGADDLNTAQLRKLDYWLDQLALPPDGLLLDIGCGWGGMLRLAGDRRPDVTATGLTLSPAQAAHVAALDTPVPVRVVVESWEEHVPDAPYDGIVSLGAFEHFARPSLCRSERVANYEVFFSEAFGWLRSGRRLGIQTIALEDEDDRGRPGLARFFTHDVFPESSVPRLGEVVEAAEGGFRLVGFRSDPDDYVRTCRAWRYRLHTQRHRANRVADPDTVRRYRKMLFLADLAFSTRAVTLYRLVFERRPRWVTSTRGGVVAA